MNVLNAGGAGRGKWGLLFLSLLVLVSAAGWGDNFIPDKGEGFFPGEDEDFFKKRPPAPEPGEGEAAAAEKPKKRYTVNLNTEMAGLYNFDFGNILGILSFGGEWSPLPHLGIGLDVGICPWPEYGINVDGPEGYHWDTFKDYITLSNKEDQTEGYSYAYSFILGGDFPLTEFELNCSYYISDRGLYGLYGGIGAGLFVDWDGFDFQFTIGNPIYAAGGGDVLLPSYKSWVAYKITPHIGYKLVLFGISIDAQVGYTFSSWYHLNGFTWTGSIGYSFGGK